MKLKKNLKMMNNYKLIGDYIRLVDKRNKDLAISLLRGVSTTKQLIESVANMSGVSLHNYKIVENRQFVYVSDTSRRGDKIGIALNTAEPCIVSSIYTVFESIDKDVLLPEYLFIWFNRSEFDRYTRFHSWGSARETFNWEDMCNIKLPIPDIKVQEAIVTIYHTLETRKRINEQLKNTIKPLCPVLMRGVVESMKLENLIMSRIDQFKPSEEEIIKK